MTVTRKGTREAAAAATTKEFQKCDHKSVANGKKEEEEDSTLDSEKRQRDIEDWISRPREPPLRNKDEEAKVEEEDVGATQASTEDNSPIDEYEEGCEFNWEDNREDTMLLYAKNTKEEASSMH